jgi:hypothetical protein
MSNMPRRNPAQVNACTGVNGQADAARLPLLRLLTVFALAVTLAVGAVAESLPAGTTGSNKASAHVSIGATVLRHIGVRVLVAPRTLQISAADIVLGYVDVPQASTLEIRSNSPAGYLLAIYTEADFSRGTEVRGSGGVALLGRSGGVLSFKAEGKGMRTTPVALSFRVLLSPQARPGVYPWPMQISVLPV